MSHHEDSNERALAQMSFPGHYLFAHAL